MIQYFFRPQEIKSFTDKILFAYLIPNYRAVQEYQDGEISFTLAGDQMDVELD